MLNVAAFATSCFPLQQLVASQQHGEWRLWKRLARLTVGNAQHHLENVGARTG